MLANIRKISCGLAMLSNIKILSFIVEKYIKEMTNVLSKDINFDVGARNVLDKKNIQSVYDYSEPGRSIFVNTLIHF